MVQLFDEIIQKDNNLKALKTRHLIIQETYNVASESL